MDLAHENDIVTIHYTIRYTNGELYDTTEGKEPISFKLNSPDILPFIPTLIKNMSIGEVKTITIKAKDAFGEKLPTLIKSIKTEAIPNHVKQEVGNKIEIQQKDALPLQATIIDVQDTYITIDANPAPIGKDLVIKIEIIDIESENS